ncbi:MAG TPA: hypothetical protein VGO48_10505 [Conexibacter sp.]|jgi:hypothetical protein|nr:hypothetical protein [Conexibacter sp.]
MTFTDPTPPPTAAHATSWELCDHCQAPLAERQRYCVVCGARRAHADDPAARYFVESARRARATEAAPAPGSGQATAAGSASRTRFALVFALLPLVAALGIVVGRGSGNDQQLVDALKAQKAPIVNVMGGGASTASDTSSGDAGSGSGSKGDSSDPAKGDVIARTRYGSARSLTDSRVTPQQLEESRRALDHIVNSKGRAYVDQQRNLPDQIIIP